MLVGPATGDLEGDDISMYVEDNIYAIDNMGAVKPSFHFYQQIDLTLHQLLLISIAMVV